MWDRAALKVHFMIKDMGVIVTDVVLRYLTFLFSLLCSYCTVY